MSRKHKVSELMERFMSDQPAGQRKNGAPAETRLRRDVRLVRPERAEELPPEPEAPRRQSERVQPETGVLAGRIADVLATSGEWRSVDVAGRLALDPIDIRDELLQMEKLGIVYRTGRTRGTRWFLG